MTPVNIGDLIAPGLKRGLYVFTEANHDSVVNFRMCISIGDNRIDDIPVMANSLRDQFEIPCMAKQKCGSPLTSSVVRSRWHALPHA